ncbi:MAG: hypothetical protein C0524_00935 [Rhodobacter sp.]|nr:hypothetical protein [Rhodobacter sp.]
MQGFDSTAKRDSTLRSLFSSHEGPTQTTQRALSGDRLTSEFSEAIERGLAGAVTYYESLDLIDAFHQQTILANTMNGAPLPVANGAPLRLPVERQLGYKMAKYVHTIGLVDSPATLGPGRRYECYAGI